jgi:hypothetical protein
MRKLKILALLGISAIAAMALAGTASASEFEAEEIEKALSATTLAGHVLTLTEKKVECGSTKFEGTTTANSDESLTVHPVYSECKAFGLTGTTVTTTGCDYRFNANTSSGMGSLSIVDHAGETCGGIVITVDPVGTTCTISIPKQTSSGALSYTNNSGKIKVKWTATKIEANVTASSGLCPLTSGVHSAEKGASYNGESEFSAAGTNLKWWEANAVPPKFGVFINPNSLIFKKNDKRMIKIEDQGAAGENWEIRATILQPARTNWKEYNVANCVKKMFTGGNKEKCEFEVECIKEEAKTETIVTIYWTFKGRLDESFFGDLECNP